MKKKEFNGYDFDDPKMAKRMKYLVVFRGDLNLNGCYAFANKKDVVAYMKTTWKNIDVLFEVKYVGKFRGPAKINKKNLPPNHE